MCFKMTVEDTPEGARVCIEIDRLRSARGAVSDTRRRPVSAIGASRPDGGGSGARA
jgi:hypothetical protein